MLAGEAQTAPTSSSSTTATISAWSRLTALKRERRCRHHGLQACSTSSGWQQQQQQQLVERLLLAVQQQ
jgi:hypothetical protein